MKSAVNIYEIYINSSFGRIREELLLAVNDAVPCLLVRIIVSVDAKEGSEDCGNSEAGRTANKETSLASSITCLF